MKKKFGLMQFGLLGLVVTAIIYVVFRSAGLVTGKGQVQLAQIPQEMTILAKESGRDFRILNLSDIQLDASDWTENNETLRIALETITVLVEQEKPDMITITGDLSYAGQYDAYEKITEFIDDFGIPWAPVMGNRDNQGGSAMSDAEADIFMSAENCLFRKGPSELGCGNYTVVIFDDGLIVEGLIFMDSHNRVEYVDADSITGQNTDCLTDEQLDWYREQVRTLDSLGCTDTTLFTHAPIYAYREAIAAAQNADYAGTDIPPEESGDSRYWNEGYEGSFGVCCDNVGSHDSDDGAFAPIKAPGSTKNVICGHDHNNNFSVEYQGVRLTYGMKTGPGGYWLPELSGGTVITVGSEGVSEIRHAYIDVR